MQKRIFFKNLDGLRFLCFMSVFFYHSFHTDYIALQGNFIYRTLTKEIFGNGNLGVNFFFVLSGFLITYLLIEEKKLNKRINIASFWIRRILRIWPLYFVCVLFGFYIFPVLKAWFGGVPDESANIWYYVLLINNFDFINSGPPDASILGVLWSIAIEEQFYFIWPILLALIPIRNYWFLFLSVIGISVIFRAANDSSILHEIHTLSCIGDMAVGALGAWCVQFDKIKSFLIGLGQPVIISFYIILAFIFFFRDDVMYANHYIRVFERILIALVMLFVILEQSYCERSFFKMSDFKLISKLGEISYGLYALHFVGILIAINLTKVLGINTELWQVLLLETTLALVFTIALSKLSYAIFEQPFLKLKKRFSYFTK